VAVLRGLEDHGLISPGDKELLIVVEPVQACKHKMPASEQQLAQAIE